MKKTIILLVLILLVSITACTKEIAPEPIQENNPPIVITDIQDEIEQEIEDVTDTKEDMVADIEIINEKIVPKEITVSVGKTTSLVIHNKEDETTRFEIPMYKSDVSVDIEPGQYEIIEVTPTVKGLWPIEIEGSAIGTIYAE